MKMARTNLAPISFGFLGLAGVVSSVLSAASKTAENILRTKECVINLPSAHQAGAVKQTGIDDRSPSCAGIQAAKRLPLRSG